MDLEAIFKECTFKTSRSGGKGGQNVNKVETKVELLFDAINSVGLNYEEKSLIAEKWVGSRSKEGYLQVVNQTERSQIANKQLCEKKLVKMLQKAFVKEKIRKESQKPKGVLIKIEADKRQNSIKKSLRQKVSKFDDADLF
jgi:ribosome-associated protein